VTTYDNEVSLRVIE